MSPDHFEIAIVGGGLAGLSLLHHLHAAGHLADRTVAIIDPAGRKTGYDRSWSFWERTAGPFEDLVYHRWPRVTLANHSRHCSCDLAPYEYKLIRSTEFYRRTNELVDALPRVTRLTARAGATEPLPGGGRLRLHHSAGALDCDYLFDSRPTPYDHRALDHPYLDQHFRGWVIEAAADTFDPGRATLMDFRTPQCGETRFLYVLPFSARRALVEVAIFSNRHLEAAEYDRIIADYLGRYWTAEYRIEHTESGNIPMTTQPYPLRRGNHVHLGLGGGAARPSTGYTFYGLQRQLAALAADFPRLEDLRPWPRRHALYDATLLRILQGGRLAGSELFVNLFADNPPARVLAFLNGESSPGQELRLMATTPVATFGRTFLGELKNFL